MDYFGGSCDPAGEASSIASTGTSTTSSSSSSSSELAALPAAAPPPLQMEDNPPDYFAGSGGIRSPSSSAAASNPTQHQQELEAFLGAATVNPFKLSHAQPTAFPVQNGASLGFQQALLAGRHRPSQGSRKTSSSTSRSDHAGTVAPPAAVAHRQSDASTMTSSPLETPGLSGLAPSLTATGGSLSGSSRRSHPPHFSSSSSAASAELSAAAAAAVASPGLHKRHHHPSSHSHKSVRTPILSSPRRLPSATSSASTSPASSTASSPASSTARSKAAGAPASETASDTYSANMNDSEAASMTSVSERAASPLAGSSAATHHPFKNLPKLSLSGIAGPASPEALSKSSASSPTASFNLGSLQSPLRSATLPILGVDGRLSGACGGAGQTRSSMSGRASSGSSSHCSTAGASTVSTGLRRGSAVTNPHFKAVTPAGDLAGLLNLDHTSLSSSASSASSAASYAASHSSPMAATLLRQAGLLVLDLRPHTAYVSQGRIKGSINICVPSTLLRRPNFGLGKVAETLCSRREREYFNAALSLDGSQSNALNRSLAPPSPSSSAGVSPVGPAKKVLVLDAESTFLTADGLLNSLLNKLDKATTQPPLELYWLKGGFAALETYLQGTAIAERSSVVEASDPKEALSSHVDFSVASDAEDDDEEDYDTADEQSTGDGDGDAEMTDSSSVDQLSLSQTSSVMARRHSGDGNSNPHSLTRLGDVTPSTLASMMAGDRPLRSNSSSGSSGSGGIASVLSADSLFPSSAGSSSQSPVEAGYGSASSYTSASNFDPRKLSLPFSKTGPGKTPSISSVSSAGSSSEKKAGGAPVIRPKNLPMSAFQFGSTAAAFNNPGAGDAERTSTYLGKGVPAARHESTGGQRNDATNFPVAGPGEARAGPGGHQAPPGKLASKQAANPFFDNIRQNVESQSLETMLSHVKPLQLPEQLCQPSVVKYMPDFLRDIVNLSPTSRAVRIHKEFFEIEQNEQKRLQNILDWHCSQCTTVPQQDCNPARPKQDEPCDGGEDTEAPSEQYHPFSIAAGVEKGHLNRYKNMWPYEHARVRLADEISPHSGDYINASHITLRGTSKRYIASQGPLESTTEHFWQLVLQEKVSTIVMLTLLTEGGREKCYNYFKTAQHGDITVTLKDEKGESEALQQSVTENFGFFGMDPPVPTNAEKRSDEDDKSGSGAIRHNTPAHLDQALRARLNGATVRRTIEVRRKSDGASVPPHVVTHIQYIRWPDFDIPPDPQCVIDLINETERAQQIGTDKNAPILVHCSAGVGRTGTFIAVQVLLERWRNSMLDQRATGRRHPHRAESTLQAARTRSPSSMQVDTPSARTPKNGSDVPPGQLQNQSDQMQAMRLDSSDSENDKDQPSSPSSNRRPGGLNHATRSHSETSSSASSTASSSASGADGESKQALIARLKCKELLPEDITDPIKSLVDQMREQRMSSVANAGQYVFTYLAVMSGIHASLLQEGLV